MRAYGKTAARDQRDRVVECDLRVQRRVGVFASLAVLAVLAACALEDTPADDVLLPELSDPVVDAWEEDSTWVIAQLRMFGDADGPLGFGLIVDAALRSDGVLAVADRQNCSVIMIHRPDYRLAGRYGTCGTGPGEFQQLMAITFLGDSLIAYDRGSNALVILDPAGAELSRVRLSLPLGVGIQDLHVVDDSTMVVSLESVMLAADTVPGRELSLVSTLDLRSGALRNSLIFEVPKGIVGGRDIVRRKAACVRDIEKRPHVIAMNDWSFEGVAFELYGKRERFHFVTDLPLSPQLTSDGTWTPGGVLASVACAASGAVFKVSKIRLESDRAPVTGRAETSLVRETFLEVRGYDGSLLLRKSIRDDTAFLHGLFGAGRGDTIFIVANTLRDYPMVGEFTMLPRAK